MTPEVSGYLRVRAGGAVYCLGVQQIIEVADGCEVLSAPGTHPAVRGVTPARDGLVPLVQLSALVADEAASDEPCATTVLARCSGAIVAFEVDDAEELMRSDALPVPEAWQLPWATGVVRHQGELIPVIDLELLAEKLTAARSEGDDERG